MAELKAVAKLMAKEDKKAKKGSKKGAKSSSAHRKARCVSYRLHNIREKHKLRNILKSQGALAAHAWAKAHEFGMHWVVQAIHGRPLKGEAQFAD